ncbi:MAG: hypothetical protein AVDCRST_MAG93-888, partial [uncultured Chloroflexia bacterium]
GRSRTHSRISPRGIRPVVPMERTQPSSVGYPRPTDSAERAHEIFALADGFGLV